MPRGWELFLTDEASSTLITPSLTVRLSTTLFSSRPMTRLADSSSSSLNTKRGSRDTALSASALFYANSDYCKVSLFVAIYPGKLNGATWRSLIPPTHFFPPRTISLIPANSYAIAINTRFHYYSSALVRDTLNYIRSENAALSQRRFRIAGLRREKWSELIYPRRVNWDVLIKSVSFALAEIVVLRRGICSI